jgi:RNA recognition motif-containing protein
MEIFVNNLSYQVEEDALREPFARYGEVRRVTVVRDRETGKSRGFGFVDMPDPEAAKRALAELNGKNLDGRPLMLSEARPRPPPGERPFRPAGAGPGGPPPRAYTGPARPFPNTGAPAGPPAPRLPSFSPPRAADPDDDGPGGAARPDVDPDLQEQRRRVIARLAGAASREKKRPERFEEGKRRPGGLKGAEKGRRNRLDDDLDDDADLPPVRIR